MAKHMWEHLGVGIKNKRDETGEKIQNASFQSVVTFRNLQSTHQKAVLTDTDMVKQQSKCIAIHAGFKSNQIYKSLQKKSAVKKKHKNSDLGTQIG